MNQKNKTNYMTNKNKKTETLDMKKTFLDEDLVTRLRLHFQERKDRINEKMPILDGLIKTLMTDEFQNLSHEEYKDKLLILLKSSNLFDNETQINNLVELELTKIYSSCEKHSEKNLRGNFSKIFPLSIRIYAQKIIIEMDKFDKTDLNPDFLFIHTNFVIDIYKMELKVEKIRKENYDLFEELKKSKFQ
jgi:hypothetical protein